jgi:hypothetical protein
VLNKLTDLEPDPEIEPDPYQIITDVDPGSLRVTDLDPGSQRVTDSSKCIQESNTVPC